MMLMTDVLSVSCAMQSERVHAPGDPAAAVFVGRARHPHALLRRAEQEAGGSGAHPNSSTSTIHLTEQPASQE